MDLMDDDCLSESGNTNKTFVTPEMVNEWKKYYLREGHTVHSTLTYFNYIKRYVGYGILINQKSVDKFRIKNMSSASSGSLKNFFNFLINKKDFPIEISYIRFDKSKSTKKIPKSIDPLEIERIINAMESLIDKNLTLVTYELGLRISESLKLTWADFNWINWIQDKTKQGEVKLINTKGGKFRVIPVPSELMNKLYNEHSLKSSTNIPIGGLLFDYGISNYADKGKSIHENQYDYIVTHAEDRYRKLLYKVSNNVLGKKVNPHMLRHCLKENCEILTIDGWKKYNKLIIGELVPTLNIQEDKIELCPIKNINTYKINEEVYNLKNRYLDYICTKDHNGLFNIAKQKQINNKVYTEWNGWNLISIDNLIKERNKRLVKHRISGIYNGFNSIGKSKASILGWILTDCYMNRDGQQIVLSQSIKANKYKCDLIRNNLVESGIPFSEKIYGNYMFFNLLNGGNRQWKRGDKLDWIFEWINKNRTPKYKLLTLKNEELEEIFKSIMLGDGTNRKDGYKCNELTTQNKERIDFFRALCCVLGKRTILGYKKNKNGFSKDKNKQYYRTYLTERNNCEIYPKDIKKENYIGIVWCPETENGTFIVKSNESIFITGNSKAQDMMNNGVPIETIKAFLGHARISSTELYAQASSEKLKKDLLEYNEKIKKEVD